MDSRVKILLINLSPDWKCFASGTGLNAHIVDYIDCEYQTDQLKMESFLKKLVKKYPSTFMALIKKSLTAMGKMDLLNEIKQICK